MEGELHFFAYLLSNFGWFISLIAILASGLIFHSDNGAEYNALAYRSRLASVDIVQSTNRVRRVSENAHMESFFHSMK